jgi:transposase
MSHEAKDQYFHDQPDPEVEPRAVRRQYTSEYKQRILDAIDQVSEPGEKGAILRREGLYSQLISKWRQQRAQGGMERLTPQKRGPKIIPEANELAQLKRDNERLRRRLEKAELVIEVQKKVSQILGMDENEPNSSR